MNSIFKISVFCFIFFWVHIIIAQDTKQIIEKFDGSKQISESHSVLKSNNQIKHGEYISYFKVKEGEYNQIKNGNLKIDDFIKIKGSYENGKKNGEWIEYLKPYLIKTKGKYIQNKKVGVWHTSRENGQVIEKFDYDTNKKLPPEIHITAISPEESIDTELGGMATVQYTSHSDCSISNIIVLKSPSSLFDKSAIEAVKKLGELQKIYGVDCVEKTETITFDY